MMKKYKSLGIALIATMSINLCALTASAAVSVRYYNQDSKRYDLPVKCGSSFNTSSKVSFNGSTTGTATIQGPSPCRVTISNSVILKGGEKIKIKNGKINIE